jgi:hypothetical protein
LSLAQILYLESVITVLLFLIGRFLANIFSWILFLGHGIAGVLFRECSVVYDCKGRVITDRIDAIDRTQQNGDDTLKVKNLCERQCKECFSYTL